MAGRRQNHLAAERVLDERYELADSQALHWFDLEVEGSTRSNLNIAYRNTIYFEP